LPPQPFYILHFAKTIKLDNNKINKNQLDLKMMTHPDVVLSGGDVGCAMELATLPKP
jgi:hypothetical protein